MKLQMVVDAPVRRPPSRPVAAPAAPRALAIDALRGLAVAGMVLYSAQPLVVLPAWMYHAQEPPPTHAQDLMLAGLTWPDIVFPIFIFTLGAALPLALTPRLERGVSPARVAGAAFVRAAILVFFALFRQHIDPTVSPLGTTPTSMAIGVAGFAALLAVLMRLPATWGRGLRAGVRAIGWTAAVAMLALAPPIGGAAFSTSRIDVIILILAYCVAFGTLVWLATRGQVPARLAVLAGILAVWWTGYHTPYLSALYAFNPLPGLYGLSYLHCLAIVIPGTIAGEAWLRRLDPGPRTMVATLLPRWTRAQRMLAIAATLLLLPVVLAGVQSRLLPETSVAAALLCAAAIAATRRPSAPSDRFVASSVRWGSLWLVLGLVMDPIEGGTSKVPDTIAWALQGAGLASFLLAALSMAVEHGGRSGLLRPFVETGQNPMLAYVAYPMLLLPVLVLSGIKGAVDGAQPAPWVAFAWGVLVTAVVVLIVRTFTRHGIVWRS